MVIILYSLIKLYSYEEASSANLRGGEAGAGALWDKALGEVDFFLAEGEVPREGDDTLPERSSDVIDRLALCELSDRSLSTTHVQKDECQRYIIKTDLGFLV